VPCPAGALDVAPDLGDADDLDERGLDQGRRRHVDGVHGVVGHPLADLRLIVDESDAEQPEVVGWADAAEHQQLGAAHGARR
jgi:hypothetical protein